MLQLFDYVKLVFSRKKKDWEEVKDTDKSRNFFMLNRFMSIQFPIQASHLCHYKINPVEVSNHWHRTVSGKFTSVPGWVYAKTVKKKDVSKKIDYPSEEMINWYCAKNELSRKDFDQHANFFKEDFLNDIKKLEKTLKSQGLLSS